jgi:hypothetical protein
MWIMVSMLQWWRDNEMPYTPEQTEELFHQLVVRGVQNPLHVPSCESASINKWGGTQ